jgi:Ran GTPase-activating protein (RanGAP) involved in mRNA processing and transport
MSGATAGSIRWRRFSNTTKQESNQSSADDNGEKVEEIGIEEALRSKVTKVIDLDRNELGPEGIKEVVSGLENNTTLEHLYLNTNDVGDEGAIALSEVLLSNTTLKSLLLDENQIRYKGAAALANLIKTNNTLQELSLASNFIALKGAVQLANALRTNQSLLVFNMSCNIFFGTYKKEPTGDDMAIEFAKVLHDNSTLQSLDLSHSQIRPKGAWALAKALASNTGLRHLYLDHNYVGNEGAKLFAKALKFNSTLQTLTLCQNQIEDEGANALYDVLKERGSSTAPLQFLDLQSNVDISPNVYEANPTKIFRILKRREAAFESRGA